MAKKTKKIHHDHIAEGLRTLAVDITTLRQDPANARLHNDQNIESIMSSLSKFGQRKPVVVNKRDGIVEAGNGTLQAAKALGWSHVAAVFVDDDPATATGFAIADNRTAELATWDEETLGRLLESIGDEMPAIELGFSDEQLAEIMAPLDEDPVGEDVEPTEPPKEPVSQRGEVYELGPHRLMCGDSTSKEDVAALMGGEKADAVLTDPPYGISQPGVTNDEPELLQGLIDGSIAALPMMSGVCVAFASPRTFPVWLDAIRKGGHKFERMLWLYKEAQLANPWRGWIMKSEAVLVSSVGDGNWNEAHPYSHDVYKLPCVQGELDPSLGWHGSIKPIAVVEDIAKRISKDGQLVYDPFLGSGTTLIAAARQGRRCFGLEISPAYCDVIRKRWGDYARENDLEAGSGAL